ncbi:Imm17 family immunity protein [Tenacibaculum maritimum]|uniref:Imm17 family immunity protein n=1 Tax=Tenacibaculum maritimum TaxID=107401 RepID=UPI0038773A47
MEKFSSFFDNLFNNIRSNPSLAGFVISGIGGIMLIAVIMDADWMLEGGNGFFNIASISNYFGRNIARVLMAFLSIIIIAAGLLIAWGA